MNTILLIFLLGIIFIPLITLILIKDEDVENWEPGDWVAFFIVFGLGWIAIAIYTLIWALFVILLKLSDKLILIFKKTNK
jgi:hypothetical protein